MPPTRCSPICKNSMNDMCIEDYSIKRDASWFEMKPGLKLQYLPSYPVNDTEDMTKDEKFKSVVIYRCKAIDHLMDKIYTVPQVAKYSQISRNKMHDWVMRGKIPHIRIERNVGLRESDLQAWIEAN